MRYELPEQCAYVIGGAPYRTFVGQAWCDACQDAYVVLWDEQNEEHVFVGARFIAGVVHEATDAMAQARLPWLTKVEDVTHVSCAPRNNEDGAHE